MSAGVGRPLVVAGADLAVLLLSLSLALGFVHPLGNPRATATVATDSPSTMLLEPAMIPVEVRSRSSRGAISIACLKASGH